jgi:hypothetical protein
MATTHEPQAVWAITAASNPRKGVRGTLSYEDGAVRFAPVEVGAPGFAVSGGDVIAARKAPGSPIIELELASYPNEVLLYFAEPSFFFQDWTELYRMAFADVFLSDAVNEWLGAFRHPQPERVIPEWTSDQEERLQELERIREQRGLTDQEAGALGRLYAERSGDEYGGVEGRPHPDLDRKERLWRWSDVNTPAEGDAWYAGTTEVETNYRARQVNGRRPPPHSRNR